MTNFKQRKAWLIVLLVAGGAGCMSADRYVVDGGLLRRIGETPAPELLPVGLRRVGDLTVQIACDEPLGSYAGVVSGAAGPWQFEGLTMPEADSLPCNSRPSLDRMAAHAASLYVHQRGAVAARRDDDGEKVQVRLRDLDFSTLSHRLGRTTVARGRNRLWIAPAVMAPIALALIAGGAVLVSEGPGDCSSRAEFDLLGCQLGVGARPVWGGALITFGGVVAVAAAIVAVLAGFQYPSEVSPRAPSLIHFMPEASTR